MWGSPFDPRLASLGCTCSAFPLEAISFAQPRAEGLPLLRERRDRDGRAKAWGTEWQYYGFLHRTTHVP